MATLTLITDIEAKKRDITQRMEKQMRAKVKSSTYPLRALLSYYRSAMMEVETKFRVLDDEFSSPMTATPSKASRRGSRASTRYMTRREGRELR